MSTINLNQRREQLFAELNQTPAWQQQQALLAEIRQTKVYQELYAVEILMASEAKKLAEKPEVKEILDGSEAQEIEVKDQAS